MINEYYAKKFCKDDISLIENYDNAIKDKTQTWHCHHRRETIYSKSDLIEIGEYYNRPAIELIFLTPKEHRKLHKPNLGKKFSEETRRKMSESLKCNKRALGHKLSEDTKRKISEYHKGKKRSEETRRKMSESQKGKKRGPYKKKSIKNQSF